MWPARRVALDPTRIEQFLALQRELFTAADTTELAARLAQGIATFVGVDGVAVGVLDQGVYRVIGTYGVAPDYAARYDGTSLGDSELAPALVSGRPLILAASHGADVLQTLVLPFTGGDPDGAVHLITAAPECLRDEDIEYGRILAVIAGLALGSAERGRRLAAVARLKGDALATMAHDLRAPLNALVGYAGLLGEGAFGPLTAEQRQISATLERQAVELIDLLGATLDVARLETGRLPIRRDEFSLEDVLAALRAGTFARPTRDGRLACHIPADLPALHTDRIKVKEIVQNLVDNALKHSGERAVEVEAALSPARDALRLTVRNDGPGIPPDLLPHLFEPFHAGDANGTGFGLYIVRRFVEALGGGVAARSVPGAGTAVTVELPLVAPAR